MVKVREEIDSHGFETLITFVMNNAECLFVSFFRMLLDHFVILLTNLEDIFDSIIANL